MAKLATLFLVVFLSQNIWAAPSASKIHPALQSSLKSNAPVDILISFVGGTGNALAQVKSQSFATRASRASAVADALKNQAEPSQKAVLAFLETQAKSVAKIESLWISNQIYVRGASAALVQSLAEFDQVSIIKEDERIPLAPFEVLPGQSPKDNGILAEWGVENIRAHQVWAAPGGNSGEGVVIATIDTGARGTHESLRNNYAGLWHDPYANTATPNDQNGHGTHTTSNIAGAGGVGVAPGARWIACKGCDTSSCTNAALLSCGQWTVCPNSGCSGVPNLVSNSWGGGRGNNFYDAAINAFHAARIIPLFSNGNSGSACNTANSPADSASGVLAIGSTTSANALSSFSSKGPSIFGTIKPDISAPGSSINAGYHTSDTAYAVLSGTSMSCPHAAGAVALLLSKDPTLSYERVRTLLFQGAVTNLTPTGQNCGGISDAVFPNHSYGHGKVDALNSFNALLASIKN